ncbi:MAG: hypothetical protein QOH91_2622 [Mycobacterium sp.]|jgi:hypothetical protein|nr:hypothetical protein [Mycobacterium sp.]
MRREGPQLTRPGAPSKTREGAPDFTRLLGLQRHEPLTVEDRADLELLAVNVDG